MLSMNWLSHKNPNDRKKENMYADPARYRECVMFILLDLQSDLCLTIAHNSHYIVML